MTNEREPISKKLRFDVFKRDIFKCQYCGSEPPKVVLEIDHIQPVSKGGKSNIDNLITACFDCNRGKKDISLTISPQNTTEKLLAIQEKEDQYKALMKLQKAIEKRKLKEAQKVNEVYSRHFPQWYLTDRFLTKSVFLFISQLGINKVVEAMESACERMHWDEDKAIKYFCGICWRKIKGED